MEIIKVKWKFSGTDIIGTGNLINVIKPVLVYDPYVNFIVSKESRHFIVFFSEIISFILPNGKTIIIRDE